MVDATPKTTEVMIFASHKALEGVADEITLQQS